MNKPLLTLRRHEVTPHFKISPAFHIECVCWITLIYVPEINHWKCHHPIYDRYHFDLLILEQTSVIINPYFVTLVGFDQMIKERLFLLKEFVDLFNLAIVFGPFKDNH